MSLHLRHEIHACVCTYTWLLHSLLSHSAGGVVDCLSLARSAARAVFGLCFHCLRVGLSWGTGRGDGGEAGAAMGSQEGPLLRRGCGSGAGRAVCGGRAAGGPARTTGAQLPSEAGGQLPHLRHLPPGPATLLPRSTSGGSPFQRWADIKRFVFGKFWGRHCPEWR